MKWLDIKNELEKIYQNRFNFFFDKGNVKIHDKITCVCNNCHNTYIRGLYELRKGKLKCLCEKHSKHNYNDVLQKIKDKNPNFDINLENGFFDGKDYNGILKVKCKKCEYCFNIKLRTAKYNKIICHNCEYLHNRKNENEVFKYIKSLGYDIIEGKYLNNKSKITVKCKECGHMFETTFNRLCNSKDRGCKYCQYIKMKKDNETFVNEINNIFNKTIIPIESYKGINQEIKFKCLKCGNVWKNKPANVLKGSGCKKCNEGNSYPNKLMKEILVFKKDKLKTINEEYSVKNIDNTIKRKFRYDFFITLKNEERVLIEMDGGFHKTNNGIKKRDKIKNQIAEKNKIKLIRIDCDYNKTKTRLTYIKTNLLNSELNDLLDLNSITDDEWNKINNNILQQK